METLTTPAGMSLSYERSGSGPPLVLVHGALSDHRTNWALVQPTLSRRFTVLALARRGRGSTEATEGHGVPDEADDLLALIEAVGEPVFLLGHSYGAQCALAAALRMPQERLRKLVVYEPPDPERVSRDVLARLEVAAASGAWEAFAETFLHDLVSVPEPELAELRESDLWPAIVADARASLADLRALTAYRFEAGRFQDLRVPVLLQVGADSPRHLYVTDVLAAALPDARVTVLPGQAHEAMTTAPELYCASVTEFLLDGPD
ncbi:alpha/beta fold hydrolase [Ornithinimicrobium cerasi]|uniref:Pimeloyl-ACP methyl ester carboxylesterase n=1 Tax=Ornithinimicrobium cerasi TaxID=2248773 RepID=A0A285VI81_9MICO|nr:alpha/beta hydrolase [Ornithinimicrobium cerasi]SOC53782.1 Pimeloyl-ACP methyl ester carboxylesterase [Ornithinimicrobium cerasi]